MGNPWDFPGKSTGVGCHFKIISFGGLPSSSVGRTSPSNAGRVGSILGWEVKIPHDPQPRNKNVKQKQCCKEFTKDLKISPSQEPFRDGEHI